MIARPVVDGRSPNQAKTDGSAYTRELGIKPIEVRFVEEQRAVKADGSFFELPHPVMQKRTPDEAQFRDKLDWVERLLRPLR